MILFTSEKIMNISTVGSSASSEGDITANIAQENIKVISAFPGLGNRLMTTWSSWRTSGEQPLGDSAARVTIATNHLLSRSRHVYWALQVGYEYVGLYAKGVAPYVERFTGCKEENLSSLHTSITLTFNKVFENVPLVSEIGEMKRADGDHVLDHQSLQITEFRKALKGFRNLCLVYGCRYIQNKDKCGEVAQLFHAYADQYRRFCSLQELSNIEDQVCREVEFMQAEIQRVLKSSEEQQPLSEVESSSRTKSRLESSSTWSLVSSSSEEESRVSEPFENKHEMDEESSFTPISPVSPMNIQQKFTELEEGRQKYIALLAIQGIHNPLNGEEVEPYRYAYKGREGLIHSQVPVDINRGNIVIAGNLVERGSDMTVEMFLAKLEEAFPEYTVETRARMLEFLAAQTFTAFGADKAFAAYMSEGMQLFQVKNAYTSMITQDESHVIFTKRFYFWRANPDAPQFDVSCLEEVSESKIEVLCKICIPKNTFLENDFQENNLKNIHFSYLLNQYKRNVPFY